MRKHRLNDIPLLHDVIIEYKGLRYGGKGRADSEKSMLAAYKNELQLGAEDDGILFWIGLADAQFSLKELTSEVAQKGLEALDAVEMLGWNIRPDDIASKRANYAAAPMPEREKLPPSRKFRCTWKVGDTFAHLISGKKAEELGIAGKYALFRKVDDIEFGDGRLLPVVTISIWDKPIFPQNEQEFQTTPILRLCWGPLRTSSATYEYRYEYRGELLIKSKKQLSSLPLQFIGNFPNVAMPNDEYIFTNAGHMCMIPTEKLSEECCLFWRRDQFCSEQKKTGEGSMTGDVFLDELQLLYGDNFKRIR